MGVPAFMKKFACVVFDDGAIYKDTVSKCFERSGVGMVLVLICHRLGLDAFNLTEYRAGVEACFRLPEFQGLASGNSGNSAHYFVATHGDDCLLYLDPHTTQPALESLSDIVPGSQFAAGLRPARPLALRWARLNPSICLGFLVRSADEFRSLCDSLCQPPYSDVIEVLAKKPSYADRTVSSTDDGDLT